MGKKFFILIFAFICFSARMFAQNVLTLEEAIQLALNNNLDILVAKNEEDIAATLNNWGNAGRLPTVTANTGMNYSNNNLDQKLANGTEIKRSGASFRSQNISVTGTWRIFNGFRVLAAKDRLNEQQVQSDFYTRQQANQVVYNVISAYLNILRLEAQQKALKESMGLMKERMTLAENRFNIGTASKSDFLQSQNDLNEAFQFNLQNEGNILQSKAALNNLMNRPPNIAFTTSEALPPIHLDPAMYASMQLSLDTLNPALLMAKSDLKIISYQKREINANRLPTLSFITGAGLNSSNNSAGFTLRNTTYGPNAGLQLAIPIFQGNVVKQNLRVNDIQYKNQQLSIQKLRNNLATNFTNAITEYEFAKKQYDLESRNLDIVKESNMIAMERFKKASITNVELRQVQMLLIDSQTRMINALYQMKQAEADIYLLLGKFVE